jgi:lambda repressor-like predicted transcriptional regulator
MDEAQKTSEALRKAADMRDVAAGVVDALIRKRKTQGATLRQIADEAGVSYQTIANILKEMP